MCSGRWVLLNNIENSTEYGNVTFSFKYPVILFLYLNNVNNSNIPYKLQFTSKLGMINIRYGVNGFKPYIVILVDIIIFLNLINV